MVTEILEIIYLLFLSNEKRKNAINRQQLTKIHSEKFSQWILRKIAIKVVLPRLNNCDN